MLTKLLRQKFKDCGYRVRKFTNADFNDGFVAIDDDVVWRVHVNGDRVQFFTNSRDALHRIGIEYMIQTAIARSLEVNDV